MVSQTACRAVLLVVVAPLQEGWTPLIAAAEIGHTEVVHALIAAGASVYEAENVRGRVGSSVL